MSNFAGGSFPTSNPGGVANLSISSCRIGFTIGVLALTVAAAVVAFLLVAIVLVALASYFPRLPTPPFLRPAFAGAVTPGLDDATLASYPKTIYSQPERHFLGDEDDAGTAMVTTCCSICLTDYKDGEVIRQLPECGHQFHVDCVDQWLRLSATCPMCRRRLPAPSLLAKAAAPLGLRVLVV